MKQAHSELSQEERAMLESFRGQSSKNDLFVKENQLILTNLPSFEESTDLFDADKALAKVNEIKSSGPKLITLNSESNNTHKKKSRSYNWVAAAVVLLGLGSLVYSFLGDQKNTLVYTTEGETKTISLSDGSEVLLNKNSTLTLADGFGTHLRDMDLTGEAYFKVRNNDNQPFTVNTSGVKIEVLGTEFNIDNNPVGDVIEVYVHEGKVKVSSLHSRTKVLLTAAESATYNKDSGTLLKDEQGTVNATSWLTKKLRFNNILLERALKDIENHFDIEIALDNDACKDEPYTSLFNDPIAEDVLETISAVFDFQLIKSGANSYQLSGGKCK